jgi:polysaccharide export outer membrane protein
MSLRPFPSSAALRLALLAALLALPACFRPGQYIWVDRYQEPPPDDSYLIRKGDRLSINVWNNPELSLRTSVREDGRLTLPLLNDVDAVGTTPTALARALEEKLRNMVSNPVVTVVVEEARPLKVAVLGEVKNPGMKDMEAGTGLLQALAVAGGFTDYAREDAVFVLRREPGVAQPVRIRFTYKALIRTEGKAASFRLRTGDVVVVE